MVRIYRASIVVMMTLLLTGCGVQSPWSQEYHLRQYERWRTLGDRARIDEDRTAKDYYQNAINELRQTSIDQHKLIAARMDIAEVNLLFGDYQTALDKFSYIEQEYEKIKRPSSADLQNQARCLTALGLCRLRLKQPIEAKSNLQRADSLYKQAYSSKQTSGTENTGVKSPKDNSLSLICGWTPHLCSHATAYWLAQSRHAAKPGESLESALHQLLEKGNLCFPMRELVAQDYSDILHKSHSIADYEAFDTLNDIVDGADSPESTRLQNQWELESKTAKKFEENGDFTSAVASYQKALDISRSPHSGGLTREVTSLCNLAFFYINSGASAKAIPYLKECVKIQTARFGADDRGIALPLARLGRTQLTVGDTKASATNLKRAFELAKSGYSLESQFTARIECMLAAQEIEDHEFRDAELHLTRAIPILMKDLLRNERGIIDAKESLTRLYALSGNTNKELIVAEDAADFADEHGNYRDKIQTLEKLASIYEDHKLLAEKRSTVVKQNEIYSEAEQSPKWRNWAIGKRHHLPPLAPPSAVQLVKVHSR